MKLDDFINKKWLDAGSLKDGYKNADPFPHIVMEDFLKPEVLEQVLAEFPDLSQLQGSVMQFNNDREVKYASKGMDVLSPSAFSLVSSLNSDFFLNYLNELASIDEPLISDPYLEGGGYHEIKPGGMLKIHADFNKHSKLDLDRRLNLLIYLNKDWQDEWGGGLHLYNEEMTESRASVMPRFNTAVLFTTTSFTYHGHPDPLACPDERSRKSLALYYFSTGRPAVEVSEKVHSTIFKEREGEKFHGDKLNLKSVLKELCPPILIKVAKKISGS